MLLCVLSEEDLDAADAAVRVDEAAIDDRLEILDDTESDESLRLKLGSLVFG